MVHRRNGNELYDAMQRAPFKKKISRTPVCNWKRFLGRKICGILNLGTGRIPNYGKSTESIQTNYRKTLECDKNHWLCRKCLSTFEQPSVRMKFDCLLTDLCLISKISEDYVAVRIDWELSQSMDQAFSAVYFRYRLADASSLWTSALARYYRNF